MPTEFTVETLLDTERLLTPIPGTNPCGVSLRNSEEYDQIRNALKVQDAPAGEARSVDYKAIINAASGLIARQSKDLDVTVWLTEALARSYGLSGLAEGLELMQRLVEVFWESLFPEIEEDGDEGFRARPIGRLNTAFTATLVRLPITSDGRSIHEFNSCSGVPTAIEAETSPHAKAKREKALKEGGLSPEDFQRSIDQTSAQFCEELLVEINRVLEVCDRLQKACDARFKTQARPYLEKLKEQLERVHLSVLEVRSRTQGSPGTTPLPPPSTLSLGSEPLPRRSDATSKAPDALEVDTGSVQQAVSLPGPMDILLFAASLRTEDATNPVPYLLLRSWRFGPMMSRGSVDEDSLEPPSTELRMAIRKAWLACNWSEILENAERAMESPCGATWLDIQHYSHRAAKELGYEAIAAAIRGMTATYLQCIPDIRCSVMLDGSPSASPDTQAWISTEVLADAHRARSEALLDEIRSDPDEEISVDREPDALEVATNELKSGRFNEAFRILSEASAREQSGRGRVQRRIQLAMVCMEADRHAIALPLLEEVCKVIEDRNLETWEPPEFVAAPMAMLHECFAKTERSEERLRSIYDRLCSIAPMKALELADRS